jgi:hypothetical protein
MVKDKSFRIPGDQIKPLALGHGSCFATDMITVSGHKIGYMYRERPINDLDSGWRFFSGDESQDYVDDARNTMMYDVNTIANYDPDVIPFLGAPIGSTYERDTSGAFIRITDDTDS